MWRTASSIAILATCTVLGGCAVAASAPSFAEGRARAPEEGMALVYVYRDRAEPTLWGATVFFGEDRVAALRENGFTWAYLAPGEHVVRAEWAWLSGQEDSSITLSVRAGETYYLELLGISRVTGVGYGTMYVQMGSGFNVVRTRVAEEEIARCCRLQPPAAPRYPVSR